MDWLRRLFGFKTNFEIMLEHIDKTHARDMDLIKAQMGVLDKVVSVHYDRPTYAPTDAAPVKQSPTFTAEQLVDIDTSDEEWLERQA